MTSGAVGSAPPSGQTTANVEHGQGGVEPAERDDHRAAAEQQPAQERDDHRVAAEQQPTEERDDHR
eukprot:gene4151-7306_t